METSTRLAFEAVILGLRRSGAIHDHAMVVMIDELRNAARSAREALNDQGGNQIERLALTLQEEGNAKAMLDAPRKQEHGNDPRRSLTMAVSDRPMRPVWFLGFPIGAWLSKRQY